ncbi:MAG: hypothetical protein ABW123_08185, partial [Cystobacter sp.]
MTRDQDRLPEGARLRLGAAQVEWGLGFLPPVFSPDGMRMLVEDREGGRSRLHVVAAWSGQRLETLPLLSDRPGGALAVSWTAEGLKVLAPGDRRPPVVLDAASPRVLQLEGGDAPGTDLATFSADGHSVALVDDQGAVRVWSTREGRLLARARPMTGVLSGPGHSHPVALSAGGRQVAWSTGDARIHRFDVTARRFLPALEGHTERVTRLAFSPDGAWLASAAAGEPVLRVWDLSRGSCALELPAAGPPCPVSGFVGPGARLAWIEGQVLRTRDLATGASTALDIGAPLQSDIPLSASPDGVRVVARQGHALRVWNLDTGQPEDVRRGHTQPVRSVAVSPAGALAATSDDQSEVFLWAMDSGALLGGFPVHTWHEGLCFSPEGRWLAMGALGKGVHLWSLGEARGGPFLPVPATFTATLAFSPDGEWLATCPGQGAPEPGNITLWSTRDGQRHRVLSSSHSWPTCLAFSPDGRWLAAGGLDGTVTFFHASDGRPAHRVRAPDSSVHR